MTYAGEHTGIGNIGHLFVILSLVLAGISGLSYFFAANNTENNSWLKTARLFFWGHVLTTLIFITFIFVLLLNHYYEYEYIWEQSSEEMTFRYLLVCFWGGQEGSFMLWIFWNVVLGSILLFTAKKFEAHVMSVFCLIQVCLVSMLLGVYIGDWKIGSSPFALRRDVDLSFGPIWSSIPDYFMFDSNAQIGKGLNPLLQNYWMTIHPPTLFLGFALTAVPFCYAVAGLWTKKIIEWIKPALPWTFFGIMVLGAGILMGGRWAYESLNFGGFWAWDPVENASLVPWIMLVGAGHLMLINRYNNNSAYTTFIFTSFAFIFILLSTFLTRSGILGDTSVHSFTGKDMLGQLLFYMMLFVWLSIHLLLFKKKHKILFGLFAATIALLAITANTDYSLFVLNELHFTLKSLLFCAGVLGIIVFLVIGYNPAFPKPESKEENLSARDFWMFIGALVLCLSAFHVIYNTSLPALNVVFGTKLILPKDEINQFYNTYQTAFAIILTLIMAVAQFLKYKKTNTSQFFKEIAIAFGLTLIVGGLLIPTFKFQKHLPNALLLFSSIFAILANLDYIIRILKGKLNHMGASIAHIGFALLILGALISQANQKIISKNYKGYVLDFFSKDGSINNEEDVQLFKGELTSMDEYFVVFRDKKFDNKQKHLYYNVDYLEQLPLAYKKGDRVRFNFELYECNADHTARKTFLEEANYWKQIKPTTPESFFSYPLWESHKPGKVLFTLQPFLQLKTPITTEPGTKNFWSHDVFTHIRDANTSPTIHDKMEPVKLEGKVGDTLWTPGYRLLIENAFALPTDTTKGIYGGGLKIKVTHILDKAENYPLYVSPTFKIDSTGKIENPTASLKPLDLDFKITSLNLTKTQGQSISFNFELTGKEYLVLRAIRFPWIFILWWGCIIMCIGTLMAVIYRIKRNRIAQG